MQTSDKVDTPTTKNYAPELDDLSLFFFQKKNHQNTLKWIENIKFFFQKKNHKNTLNRNFFINFIRVLPYEKIKFF